MRAILESWISPPARDDDLIHVVSESLLWTALGLVLSETSSPTTFVWAGTSMLNLIAEVILAIARTWQGPYIASAHGLSHLLSILTLTNFTIVTILLPVCTKSLDCTASETQSLLSRKSSRSETRVVASTVYNTLDACQNAACSDSTPDLEDEDDLDSDDEVEVRKLQQERLKASGSWLGYVKGFKVFVPYVFPRGNLKLQLYLLIIVINILLQRILNILHPRQLGIVIDQLKDGSHIPWSDILVWSFLAVAASPSCGVAAVNEMLENRLAAWSRKQLTYASLDHVMGLSMSFHDEKDSGEVIKAIEQAESLNDILRLVITDITPSILDVVISIGYITYLFDVYASFIVLGMIIAFTYATYKITILATAARRVFSQKERDETKLIFESVSNWFTVSCFSLKNHTMSRLSRVLRQRSDAEIWNNDLYTYIYFFQEGSEHLGRLAITILAAHRITTGRSTIGDLVTLQSYWDTITWPLYMLGQNYRKVNSALVDAERLLQLFMVRTAVVEKTIPSPTPTVINTIAFHDVKFAYEGRDPTLHGISFTVDPGQTVALVGQTGSGKSTIFKLLMRFYDVSAGSISLNDCDVRDTSVSSVRDAFGYVPQDSTLFNTSILENVRYGCLSASDADVYAACEAASIHDKILSLPKGYLSQVGERGVKLSGGERQRIAIARAFLKDAPIILLDEATSAMDSSTEAKIQSALRRLTKGRTTLLIAHRLSAVVDAEKIIVVHEGRIVEQGTHSSLLEERGRYYDLWNKQAIVST